MERTPIVIVHSNRTSGEAIRDRLLAAGYGVSGPVTDLRSGETTALAIIDSSILDRVSPIHVPFILLANEDSSVDFDGPRSPEAVVWEPLRGRELEHTVRLVLQRMHRDIYRTLVQSNRRYGLFMLDTGGNVISWNPGLETVLGYKPEEIIGRHFSIFYVDQDRKEGVPSSELETASREGVADDTRWLKHKNGDSVWVEGLTTAVHDDRGELTGFAKVVRDATERRKLEVQLERSNDELQRFAYTVSHDLQEPLRTVRSYAELLERRYQGKLDRDANEFIQFMMDAAGRMAQLLRDLLAYSQAGRSDRTAPEPTSSANILQWAIMNVDRLAKEADATITYDALPMVEADQTQLSQVFQNLLGNAIKYRGQEAPRIHISAKRHDQHYEFSISDNGIGIAPEHHDRIFGVFKRLHGKEVPGTGIGLAICRKIVESHGGTIWVESEAGAGTIVKFTLPAHD